ncbi:unnamed protein product, partial [Prorocentrum cordatum]
AVCPPRAGLLYTLCGLIGDRGDDISSADISTDGCLVYSCFVLRSARPPRLEDAPRWCEEVEHLLVQAQRSEAALDEVAAEPQNLSVNLDLLNVVRFEKICTSGGVSPELRYRLELKGINQAGLLKYAALVLYQSRFSVLRARISTVDGHVSDTFEVSTSSPESERVLRSHWDVPPRAGLEESRSTSLSGSASCCPSPFPRDRHSNFAQSDEQHAGDDCEKAHDVRRVSLHFANGDEYSGDVSMFHGVEMRHGFGTYEYASSTHQAYKQYRGNWAQDQKSGYGVLLYRNGGAYAGQWDGNRKHGLGLLLECTDPTGNKSMPIFRYEGQWSGDKPHGLGVEESLSALDASGRWVPLLDAMGALLCAAAPPDAEPAPPPPPHSASPVGSFTDSEASFAASEASLASPLTDGKATPVVHASGLHRTGAPAAADRAAGRSRGGHPRGGSPPSSPRQGGGALPGALGAARSAPASPARGAGDAEEGEGSGSFVFSIREENGLLSPTPGGAGEAAGARHEPAAAQQCAAEPLEGPAAQQGAAEPRGWPPAAGLRGGAARGHGQARGALLQWSEHELAAFVACLGLGADVCERVRRCRLRGAAHVLELSDAELCQELGMESSVERLVVRQCLRRLLDAERRASSARARKVGDVQGDTVLGSFAVPPERLEIVSKMSQGGYGTVFRGVLSPGRGRPTGRTSLVAAKEMKGELRVRLHEFLKEACVMASLRHRNICAFVGVCFDTQARKNLIVSELMDCSLFDLIHQPVKLHWHGELTVFRVLELSTGICGGLAYLHNRHIVHADLKSSNILIDYSSSPAKTLLPRICDFGHAVVRVFPSPHHRCGTPQWAAPEVLRGEAMGLSADIYSFGAIMWEMLTQKLPHTSLSFSQIVATVGWAGWTPELSQLPEMPPPLRSSSARFFFAWPARLAGARGPPRCWRAAPRAAAGRGWNPEDVGVLPGRIRVLRAPRPRGPALASGHNKWHKQSNSEVRADFSRRLQRRPYRCRRAREGGPTPMQ